GTAVVVLEAVVILGLVRTLVLGVGDAVAVVVVVRTAVVVLEPVLVLGDERALVLVVRDAVVVGVAQVGCVADREEEPRVGRADRLIETGAASERDRELAAGDQAQAADRLHRAL